MSSANLLIIAGLEANGFAGVVRDVQVANALGASVSVVASCLTAQNAQGLSANQPVSCELIKQQLNSLIKPPDVVKIGVLPSQAIAMVITQWLDACSVPKPKLVLDPVWLNSGDNGAFSDDSILTIITPLLPFITLLTPNLAELEALTGQALKAAGPEALMASFYRQQATFKGAILLKGLIIQPADDQVKDILLKSQHQNQPYYFRQRKNNKSMRGTGCLLATAIACALLEQHSLESAVTLASAYLAREFSVRATLAATSNSPLNNGWPAAARYYPAVGSTGLSRPITSFTTLSQPQGLYPIVDSSQWLERLASLGVKTIQLRIKNKPMDEIEQEIQQAVQIEKKYQLQLFINDYWQLAIKCGAYGVHLGQEDLATAKLDDIQCAGLRLGISTHGDYEFLLAKQYKPSYLAVGAIFPTRTKDMSGKIQGIARLKRYCAMAGNTPVVAIGGINLANVACVLEAKPAMIAVVSAITHAQSPEASVRALSQCLASAKRPI
ncbi:thiamine phosphate synthase [Gilvimarinus polysaccharolyticus]|uniref:thiamine phosphate synthase n=1 Tax=Gilvimarinus polysaccharolyticus TaxID=863921 RepID=UPI0006731300|nr:thiamine phosphate synthase [Gilvimarinus polysaccharolyticus]